jgi:hypothetical protein
MLRMLVILDVLSGSVAHAGDCDAAYAAQAIRPIEAYAQHPGKTKPWLDEICVAVAIAPNAQLSHRLLAACDRIFEREPTFASCVRWGVELGAKQLAGHDLFDALARLFPVVATSAEALELHAKLDDLRSTPLALAAWRTGLTDTRAQHNVDDWAHWRHVAAGVLGRHGGADERAFLVEQERTARDRGVRAACRAAIDAIDHNRTSSGGAARPEQIPARDHSSTPSGGAARPEQIPARDHSSTPSGGAARPEQVPARDRR